MHRTLLTLSAVALLVACPDPAKNKPQAKVTPAAPAAAQPAALTGGETFAFSNDGSTLHWVGAKVTARHDGGFNTFSGTLQVVDGTPAKSQVKVEIAMDSVFTEPEKLVTHLKSDDFFDVQKFPTATFVSQAIAEGGTDGASHTVTGVLTLHGVSKTLTFPASIELTDGAVTVKAEFAINRKDFGIVYPGQPDNLIADQVLLKLDIHAKKAG